jgi:hypothetical protein
MKNIIKYTSLIFILLLLFIGCEDPDAIRIPDFEEGANVRIVMDPEYSSLRADDLNNAKLVFSIYSENTNLDIVEISASYYNFAQDSNYSRRIVKTYTQSDFNAANGAIRDVTLTAAELANIFGVGEATDLGGGDRFDFYNVTTLTNGLVFPDTISLSTGDFLNVTPNIINSAATTSFTSSFTAYVSCPFIVNDAVGTYEVLFDGWADWDVGDQLEVIANADGTGVIVKGMFSKFRNDDRGPYDVEVLVVDANTGIAVVEKQPAWEWFWYAGEEGYGMGSVEGGGFVFSCSGVITLSLEHTVAAGSFGNYTLTLQRL